MLKKLLFLLCLLFSLHASAQTPRLIPYRKGDLWGYCDSTKKIQLKIIYERAFPFIDGKALIVMKDKLLQVDTTGTTVSTYPFSPAEYFDGMLKIVSGKKQGYIGLDGKIVLPCIYKSIDALENELFEVKLKGKKGIVDKKGAIISPFVSYEQDDDDEDAPPPVVKDDKRVCDQPCQVDKFYEGRALVSSKTGYGFVDMKGKLVIPAKYALADSFKYGLSRVSIEQTGQKKEADKAGMPGIIMIQATVIKDGYIGLNGTEFFEE